jgi:hypothetical protein
MVDSCVALLKAPDWLVEWGNSMFVLACGDLERPIFLMPASRSRRTMFRPTFLAGRRTSWLGRLRASVSRYLLQCAAGFACVFAVFAADAHAATLADINGLVFVNHGNGFLSAPDGAALAPGDRIRTDEGSANIVYENGCSSKIGPHQVVVVLWTPPTCNEGGLKDGAAATPDGFPTGALVLGGLIGGGAVGLAVALSSNETRPNSP